MSLPLWVLLVKLLFFRLAVKLQQHRHYRSLKSWILRSLWSYLNRYGLVGREDNFSALVKSFSVTSDLQRGLVENRRICNILNTCDFCSAASFLLSHSHQRGHGEADHLDAAVVVPLRFEVSMVSRVSPRHGASTVPAHVTQTYNSPVSKTPQMSSQLPVASCWWHARSWATECMFFKQRLSSNIKSNALLADSSSSSDNADSPLTAQVLNLFLLTEEYFNSRLRGRTEVNSFSEHETWIRPPASTFSPLKEFN